MAKPTIHAKMGTKGSTLMTLWKEYKEGDTEILAMETSLYQSLHWSYRRKKTCNYWKRYFVWKATEDHSFLYLSL